MPVYRTPPRSSDLSDFEHTATLKEMEELTLAEKDHRSQHETCSPEAREQSTVVTPARPSRSSPRAIPTKAPDKVVVFRDSPSNRDIARSMSVAQRAAKAASTPLSRRPLSSHSRSISDSAVSTSLPHPTAPNARDDLKLTYINATVPKPQLTQTPQVTEQLLHIAARRAELLDALQTLQTEENNLIAELAPSKAKGLHDTLQGQSTNVDHRAALSRSAAQDRFPELSSRTKVRPRTGRVMRMSRPETVPGAVLRPASTLSTSPASESRAEGTVRIPTKFGDDDVHGGVARNGDLSSTVGGRRIARARSNSRGRSRTRAASRGRAIMPAATPGLKRWEF